MTTSPARSFVIEDHMPVAPTLVPPTVESLRSVKASLGVALDHARYSLDALTSCPVPIPRMVTLAREYVAELEIALRQVHGVLGALTPGVTL